MIKSRAATTTKPMAHQVLSLAHDAKNPIVLDTSDAGTGKTAVRILAFAARRRKSGGKLLVLGPRSVLRSTWALDFAKFAPDMVVRVGTALTREKAFDEDADAYITNHDAVKWLLKKPKAWWAQFSELVIDEIPAYKHYTSQRSRAMFKISKHFKRRAGLTATPNSNGICDVWHQVLLLDGGKRLGTSFFAFRNSTCTAVQKGRNEQAINWEDKEGAEEAVFGLLADITIRHKLDDCADIPQTHYWVQPFELPAKQRKVYEAMAEQQLLLLKNAAKVSAIHAAAVTTKLLQICSGAIYDGDGEYHVLDTERYEAVLDMVEARKHSLVYFQWKHQRDEMARIATARGITHCVLDGDVSDQDRATYVSAYQRGEYRTMFAHPRAAAHGLTLTKGTSTIWCSPTYDLEWWEQGNKRQRRIGQTEKTEVVVLRAQDTIEELVYDRLMNKNARMTNLLDLFASMTPMRKKA